MHHVLFDWEDIITSTYHVSEEVDMYAKREVEADEFAREFFFPKEKLLRVSPEILNQYFIERYAEANHVHESIIYMNYCWDWKDTQKDIFAKFRKHIPDAFEAIKAIDPIADKSKSLRSDLTAQSYAENFLKRVFNGL